MEVIKICLCKHCPNKNTIEFLGIWEQLYNNDFNSPEFGGLLNESGTNRFYLSVKRWIEKTNAIGITAKSGRHGGTYAHRDIAFNFGLYISPMFNLLLIKEFQRLKEIEDYLGLIGDKEKMSKKMSDIINYKVRLLEIGFSPSEDFRNFNKNNPELVILTLKFGNEY